MASLEEYRKLLAEAKQLAAEYGAQYSALEKRVLELRKQRARDQESPNYNPNDPINQARDAEIAGLSAEKTKLLLLRDEQNVRVTNFTNLIQRFEAEQAAAKTDNAGTGTPGTAGTGAGSTPGASAPPTEITTGASGAAPDVIGTTQPKIVTPVVGATGATGATSAVGASAPKTVGASAPPKTKPVPSPQGKPGTAEYVSGLIKGEVVKAQNALATACPNKAKAQADVKKILANLGSNVAAAVTTATDAQGKPLSQTAKSALSAELQGAISTVGKISKDIDAKNCKEVASTPPATTEQTTNSTTEKSNTVPGIKKAQAQAVLKDTTNFAAKKDWRVRLSLSPGSNYLYKASNPGILAPLQITDGVIFPYTPNITVNYNANYDPAELVHTNYKIYQYKNSSVDNVQITCDFTAQDTYEANYLLAVIHFFRSATKMFYGQDQDPKPGTPPPLCYLFGLGQFQFNAHPLVISNFAYSLPSEVDYIRAGSVNDLPGTNKNSPDVQSPNKPNPTFFDALLGSISSSRLGQGVAKIGNAIGLDIVPGGNLSGPSFQNNMGYNSQVPPGTNEPTYVPTKIQISITCNPIISRNDISNRFNLKDYASGSLLQGVKNKGGGIW